jgi:hypothetical protein
MSRHSKEILSLTIVARQATLITERLCHLYITLTQNMDPGLIKYYLQHDKVRGLFKCGVDKQSEKSLE